MMKSIFNRHLFNAIALNTSPSKGSHFNKSSLISVIMLSSALAITGCNKKNNDDNDSATEADDTQSAMVESTAGGEPDNTNLKSEIDSEPVITCDDQVAVTQLIQSIRAIVNQQSRNLLTHYGERADIPVDLTNVNNATSSMLVDVASPMLVQSQNASGMVTCKASLSLTLPTKDMHQAMAIYDNLGGDTLQQRMSAQNLSLNNNMLVSSAFTYVAGMQGGQATARVVGQPPILRSVADIIAKSKFKAATDAINPIQPASPSEKSEPLSPSQPEQPTEPGSPPLPADPSKAKPIEDNPIEKKTAPIGNTPINKPSIDNKKTLNEGAADKELPSANKTGSKTSNKKQDETGYKVPSDDSVEMVIIEEEETY